MAAKRNALSRVQPEDELLRLNGEMEAQRAPQVSFVPMRGEGGRQAG